MQMDTTMSTEGKQRAGRKRKVVIVLLLMLAFPWVHAFYVERRWAALTEKVDKAYANEVGQNVISVDPSHNLQNMGLEKVSSTEYRFSKQAFYYLAWVEYRLIVRLEKIDEGFKIDVESVPVFRWQLF